MIDRVIASVDKIRSLLDAVADGDEFDQFTRNNIEGELDGIHPRGRYGSSTMEEIRSVNELLRARTDPYEAKVEELEGRIVTLEGQVDERDSEIEDLKAALKESEINAKELQAILNNVEQIIYE